MAAISIVTICFNNLEELLASCASIDCQQQLPAEHIIVDGSTNLAIHNYLKEHTQPSYRKWKTERDEGIADAFNKGIQQATAPITLLLNSGDMLYDATVLQRVATTFDQDPQLKWIHGQLHLLRGGLWVTVGKPFDVAKLYRGMRGTFHPTMFVKKELYHKYGLFKKEFKMAMDYDFLCRIANEKNTFLAYPLARFDPSGISSTQYLKAMKESFAAYRSYYGSSWKQTLWGWRLTILHYLLQSPFGKSLYQLKVALGLANK
ncbi:MAG TPA: glycosyltransferase [Flavipsychrobacter sp.]|nr:glycosyltransferase [Flavipsychrobacter sp.]